MGQRKERRPGEYAPEALDIIDEFGSDENPDYMAERFAVAKVNTDFESVAVIEVEIPMDAVMAALRPQRPLIQGTVAPTTVE